MSVRQHVSISAKQFILVHNSKGSPIYYATHAISNKFRYLQYSYSPVTCQSPELLILMQTDNSHRRAHILQTNLPTNLQHQYVNKTATSST